MGRAASGLEPIWSVILTHAGASLPKNIWTCMEVRDVHVSCLYSPTKVESTSTDLLFPDFDPPYIYAVIVPQILKMVRSSDLQWTTRFA